MNRRLAEFREEGLVASSLPTTLAVFRNVNAVRAIFTIKNPDPMQTLDVQVYRRPTLNAEMGVSSFEGFRNIQPGEPRCIDIGIVGAVEIEFRGTASGAGITGITIDGVMA